MKRINKYENWGRVIFTLFIGFVITIGTYWGNYQSKQDAKAQYESDSVRLIDSLAVKLVDTVRYKNREIKNLVVNLDTVSRERLKKVETDSVLTIIKTSPVDTSKKNHTADTIDHDSKRNNH